jgi:hypothetical protein
VTEVQVTRWREIPSLVIARDGDLVAKVNLPSRFQEAIDEAAMRLSADSADDYMAGWIRDPWEPVAGSPPEAAEAVAAGLEEQWTAAALTALLDAIGPATPEDS